MLTARPRRDFRLWLGAATVSTLGDSVTYFALGWAAAQHSPATASLVLSVESVPLFLLILVGGLIADRWGIRRVMVVCDAVMVAVLCFFLTVILTSEHALVPVWALLTVALLSGTAEALRRPAGGVFPRLFARGGDELARTLATTSVFTQLARVAGPALGGVLVGLGGLAVTSAVDAATFVVVLGVLLVVRPPYEPPPLHAGGGSPWRQLADGISAVRATPGATATIVTVSGLAATVIPLVALCVPLLALERGWSAAATGMVAAGWVVGGLVVTSVVARRGMPPVRLALAGPGLAAAGVLLLANTDGPRAAVVALVAVGVGTSLLTTRVITRFVTVTPAAMLARFQSLLGLAQTAPILAMTPLLGYLATAIGVRTALMPLAGVLVLTMLAAHRAEAGITPPGL